MRYRALLIVAAGALALAPASAADVTLINISSPVHPGSYASLSVRAASHVACVLRVHYRSERPVFVQSRGGLFAGIIGWRWKMPTTARRGVWSADVNCGTLGSLHPKFTVR
jgi:hypothetical protein